MVRLLDPFAFSDLVLDGVVPARYGFEIFIWVAIPLKEVVTNLVGKQHTC